MGLDGVELVMEVEETFGFSIPDEDAEVLDTVGKLYDYILAHRLQGREQGCLSSVAFYKVRRALMSVCGIARRDVQLSLDLSTVIPRRRRRVWSDLQTTLELRLPELKRPVWAKAFAVAAACGLTAATAVLLAGRWGIGGAIFSVFVIMPIGIAFEWITRPLAVELRPEFSTVGCLAKAILQKNYGVISDEYNRVNADEVWNTLRTMIADQLGVRPEEVTKEANFVKDLGLS